MKRVLSWLSAAIVAAGIAASAHGQAVYLKVVPMESKRSDNYSYRGVYSGSFDKNVAREEAFNITVRNMTSESYDYVVEWMFLSSPARGGGTATPFNVDEKKLTLDKGASTTVEVHSPKLASTHNFDSYGGSTFTGSKFAGYVVRVKYNDRILAVEASDVQLKRKYQDPKVKWGIPEEGSSGSSGSKKTIVR